MDEKSAVFFFNAAFRENWNQYPLCKGTSYLNLANLAKIVKFFRIADNYNERRYR